MGKQVRICYVFDELSHSLFVFQSIYNFFMKKKKKKKKKKEKKKKKKKKKRRKKKKEAK